jgi:hypothetical protein
MLGNRAGIRVLICAEPGSRSVVCLDGLFRVDVQGLEPMLGSG